METLIEKRHPLRSGGQRQLAVLAVTLVSISSLVHAELYLNATYGGENIKENHVPGGWDVTFGKGTLPHMITISRDYAKSGQGSLKFDARFEDPDVANCPGRAELSTGKVAPKGEAWNTFSILIPADQKLGNSVGACIGQWHGTPDRTEGEDWRNPFTSLHLHKYDLSISIKGTDERIYTKWQTKEQVWNESLTKGIWYTFVFHFNWDWSQDGDGFLRVWLSKDDQPFAQIVDYKGQIGANDERGPYFKWGVYNWRWKWDKREQKVPDVIRIIAYYDDVRAGGPKSSFMEMVGVGEPPPP